jgi:membrane protein YqaA with SNARE-associated domain
MLRGVYDKVVELSKGPHALPALATVSFAESSFFPVPPDVVLVPMALANPQKARLYALVCTIASVLGGLLGYAIGALLYDTLGQWLIKVYGYGENFDAFREAYAKWGAWIILIKGLTPIPFKIVTIASGFAGYNLFYFVVLSLITRGARFFLEAELLRIYGEPIRDFIERRLTLVTTSFVVAVVGGFLIAKYAF